MPNDGYFPAFGRMLRSGFHASKLRPGISAEDRQLLMEVRDMGSGGAYPGSTSGAFVPLEFNDMVVSALKDSGPMFRLATIQQTATGDHARLPPGQRYGVDWRTGRGAIPSYSPEDIHFRRLFEIVWRFHRRS